jgi:hypothetical protein
MAKLGPQSDRILFAPLIWRLAMKIEQVPWSEMSSSATEAVFVLRSAQRLFKQDIHCVSFDTWLEAEAAGMKIERDDLGMPVGRTMPVAKLPSVENVLLGEPIVRTVETLRRLALEADSGIVPIATMTAGPTLQRRFGDALPVSADGIDYVRQILLGLTRLYCEAGAGALLLLDEEPADDAAALSEYAALFNLAEYFATPVFLISRAPLGPEELSAANAARVRYLGPDEASDDIIALPDRGSDVAADGGWIAMSRWEVHPETDPNVVQGWRQQLVRN